MIDFILAWLIQPAFFGILAYILLNSKEEYNDN